MDLIIPVSGFSGSKLPEIKIKDQSNSQRISDFEKKMKLESRNLNWKWVDTDYCRNCLARKGHHNGHRFTVHLKNIRNAKYKWDVHELELYS